MIFIYYLMFNLGQVLSERGAVPPILGLWWANGILTLAGAFLCAEACELFAAGLLSHGCDARAHLPQVRRHRQKQRTAASDDDALAGDRVSAARQRLQTARTKDARQCPSGKGEKAFARACGHDKAFVRDVGSVGAGAISPLS